MKFSAWKTSHKAPDITEAHHWRQSKLIKNHSVSLCWLVAHDKTLVAANETTPRCLACAWQWKRSGEDDIRGVVEDAAHPLGI
jgi:hypothetical protein